MEYTFNELTRISEKMRSKNGCPWVKAQTFETMKEELLSEAKEVVEAINKKDFENLKEELGDLLGDIVYIIQIAKEKNLFNEEDVLKEVIEKKIRRNPHVFGNEKAETVEDALRLWKKAKDREKK
jgi:tetrapyrrole methylase family protein/MazG family protein